MAQNNNAVTVAQDIASWFDSLFNDLHTLQEQLSLQLASAFVGEPPFQVSTAVSKDLEGTVTEYLRVHPQLDGAGLIFAMELLDPEHAKLEWWMRDGTGYARRDFILDPASERFYDYEYLEWFRGGFYAESPTIAGPYIDHLGVDEYIATMTVPAYVNGRKVGVTGMDMLMRDVEAELLRLLAPLGHGAAVLGRHGQVLVGSSGEFTSGIRVSEIPAGYARSPIQVEKLGLSLLYRV
ncbi:MAG: cache domain-containing protein [Gulosibacter sp.]|uniref:cache domain-containing protein n=1 Tax=Gulosibacter sp. TaxID=2817531 RepID=UPI003F9197BD